MKNGLFITFEGIDGCGKTTQMDLLADYLAKKGLNVLKTKEPGGVGLGEELRNILLNYNGEVSSRAESFLFFADRAQNMDIIVKPALERGEIVLCDRHIDSSVAYQGYGRNLDIKEIERLNSLATGGKLPDLTFIFDIDLDVAFSRVGKNPDRMEKSGLEFFNKVKMGYLEIAQNNPQRVKVIDSTKGINDVFSDVILHIEKLIIE